MVTARLDHAEPSWAMCVVYVLHSKRSLPTQTKIHINQIELTAYSITVWSTIFIR